jgi:hypothetical protein
VPITPTSDAAATVLVVDEMYGCRRLLDRVRLLAFVFALAVRPAVTKGAAVA